MEKTKDCKCVKCKKVFPPYPDFEECYSCDEGVYEDSDGDYVGCPFCGGKGGRKVVETEFCKTCKEELDYEDDDEW